MWGVLAILSLVAVARAQQPCGQTPIQPDMGTNFVGIALLVQPAALAYPICKLFCRPAFQWWRTEAPGKGGWWPPCHSWVRILICIWIVTLSSFFYKRKSSDLLFDIAGLGRGRWVLTLEYSTILVKYQFFIWFWLADIRFICRNPVQFAFPFHG